MKKSILSLLIFSFILCGCKNTAPLSNKEFCLDTIIQITLYDSSSKNILNNCFDLCKKYERIFSTNNKKSELYKINHSSNKLEAQELNKVFIIVIYQKEALILPLVRFLHYGILKSTHFLKIHWFNNIFTTFLIKILF